MIPYLILALTYAGYIAYHIATRYKGRSLERLLRDLSSSTFYIFILIIVFNINIISNMIRAPHTAFSIPLAEKKLQSYINENREILSIIVDASCFVAIYDITLSIAAILAPPYSLSLIAVYKPYTHTILSTLEGSAKLISLLLLLSYILVELLKIGAALEEPLRILSSLIIPPKTRNLGKGILALYLTLIIVLPYMVNTSFTYWASPPLEEYIEIKHLKTPTSIDPIKIEIFCSDGTPLHIPALVYLTDNDTYIVATAYTGKHILLPRGVYRSIGACIYWHNFTNSPCCYKKTYRECYGCYTTPLINTSRQNTLTITIPYKPIPCNSTEGIAGLFHEYYGPQPSYQNGKIVFTLTPENPELKLGVIGGEYKISYKNITGWVVEYKVSDGAGHYVPPCSTNILAKYYNSALRWSNRSGIPLYREIPLPQIGEGGAYSEYTVKVELVKIAENNTGVCPRKVKVNVTIYGSGCWNPRIAYINKWSLTKILTEYAIKIKNYISTTYAFIVNTYIIFITSTLVIILALNVFMTHSFLSFIKNRINVFRSIRIIELKPHKSKQNRQNNKKTVKDLLLYKQEKELIEKSKKTYSALIEQAYTQLTNYRIKKLLKNPEKLEYYHPAIISMIIFYMSRNNSILRSVPQPAQTIIRLYPLYFRHSFSYDNTRLEMRRKLNKGILYFVSSIKYNYNKIITLEKLVSIRRYILTELGKEPFKKKFLGAPPEEIYDLLIQSRVLPDLDLMIIYMVVMLFKEGRLEEVYNIISPKELLQMIIKLEKTRYRYLMLEENTDFIENLSKIKQKLGERIE